MLAHLSVRNAGVIASASIDPGPGFTVVTGETGAGKTLLLGSVRQILGDKASSGLVGPHGDSTSIDALFVNDDDEIGVSRTIPNDGRSQSRIDGAIVASAKVREVVGPFVELVAQHDQLTIRKPSYLKRLVDSNLDRAGKEILSSYSETWADLQMALAHAEELGGDLTALRREQDLARHQASEIDAAALTPGLDESLERQAALLRNHASIRDSLLETGEEASKARDALGEVVAHLRKISDYADDLAALRDDAESVTAGAEELMSSVRGTLEAQHLDDEQLAETEEKLTQLGDLKRKYGRTLEEVIAFGAQMKRRGRELEELLRTADTISSTVARMGTEAEELANQLSHARQDAARSVTSRLREHLDDLGLGSAQVELDVSPASLGPTGADVVTFLFASDRDSPMRMVSEVASGGELSRLVLALRLASRGDEASTLVFDEIDTGIGGETALAMGRKLAELSLGTQVLCVTHLAQVAAFADKHYLVERTGDIASVRLIEGKEREEAVARMMAGTDSDGSRSAAEELLRVAAK